MRFKLSVVDFVKAISIGEFAWMNSAIRSLAPSYSRVASSPSS